MKGKYSLKGRKIRGILDNNLDYSRNVISVYLRMNVCRRGGGPEGSHLGNVPIKTKEAGTRRLKAASVADNKQHTNSEGLEQQALVIISCMCRLTNL